MRDAMMDAPWLSAMARVFEKAGAPLYIVGGAVRNPLMCLPLSDIDVGGPTLPREVCAFCEGTEIRAQLRAAHFGTLELHLTDADGVHRMAEYTTWRQDSYRCGHRPEAVRFTKALSVDAQRRDFSVNALYRRVFPDHLGDVIDPTGGLEHMKAKILHTVTEDPDIVLRDDGLRILRAARFQAELDLNPTPGLIVSLKKHASLLRDIAPERLRDELQKILLADLRYDMLPRNESGTYRGLMTVEQTGAWPCLFPGIRFDHAAAYALGHAPTPGGTFTASGDPLCARLALLLNHADIDAVNAALTRMRFAQKDADRVCLYLRVIAGLRDSLPVYDAALSGREALLVSGAVCTALGEEDAAGRAAALLNVLTGKPASLRELAVNGSDILTLLTERGLPAKRTGEVLNSLWRLTLESNVPNRKPDLLSAAVSYLHSKPNA